MKNRYLIIFFIICSFSELLGQTATIRGIVLDESTKILSSVSIRYEENGTTTNSNGFYTLDIPSNTNVTVEFSFLGFKKLTQTFKLEANAEVEFNPILKRDIEQLSAIILTNTPQERVQGIITLSPSAIRKIPGANAGVENLLKSLPGVSNNNELSTQYSVRGGNFDENLVYVNDIEVYRPFLVRSGQQEGLSFVNSDLIQDVAFSAGGFQAKYGDKLSSVLDITYRRPVNFGATIDASLLGGSISAEGISKNGRFTAISGVRYRDNSLLVNAKQTKTNFKPRFFDVQSLLTYKFSNKFQLDFLGNIAVNSYDYKPLTRQTNFGTLAAPVALVVFYSGQEKDIYNTYFGALKGTYAVSENLTLKFISSTYHTQEQEYFDIFAEYRLGTPNTDIGDENLGEVEFTQGIGSQLTHGRNDLDAFFINIAHKGTYIKENNQIDWGIKYTREDIRDRLEEYEVIDSAGFSIRPPIPDFSNQQPYEPFDAPLEPYTNIRAQNNVTIDRLTAFTQYSKKIDFEQSELWLNAGLRTHQWTVSGENLENNTQTVLSPRAQLSIKPNWSSDMIFRASGGLYYQPPLYRELRDSIGQVRPKVKAQKSYHLVVGHDWSFNLWERPFKLVSELYYKGLSDVNPYTLENVRIRYRATNNAVARAYGFDTRLNGEFVPGTQSWISLGILKTEENIEDQGYIPRPSDQRMKVAFLFQDYAPRIPNLKLYINMVYQTGLPGGSPSYADPYIFAELPRLRDYFRADAGINYVFTDSKRKYPKGHWLHPFKELTAGFEIYNIFDKQNSITNTFVRDASSQQQYAVPNFLTPRVFNIKISAKF
ncbi:carboxypeptidase-like regulatory domain-containing protein [Dokdonia sp. Hel_I_53]|uniref:TonB-dependent receptor n=1 Tax=Dokdonia sp. Hel_I_53 TaxID=1566287 RepID=UPI001199BDDA|nr:carboxypeptidase-like regulatory domain-containing protein [Dokdonia sp. Hel_I_53]TVZ51824.1 outer membrane receptor protein involved in Fe transport [Dokdonia sp. Hel_I_53]